MKGWLSLSQTSKSQLDLKFLLKLQHCIGSAADLTPLQNTKLTKLLFQNKDLFGEKQGVTPLIKILLKIQVLCFLNLVSFLKQKMIMRINSQQQC